MLLEKRKYEFPDYHGWRTRDKLTKGGGLTFNTFSLFLQSALKHKEKYLERQSEELAHESAWKLSLLKAVRVEVFVKINCEKLLVK